MKRAARRAPALAALPAVLLALAVAALPAALLAAPGPAPTGHDAPGSIPLLFPMLVGPALSPRSAPRSPGGSPPPGRAAVESAPPLAAAAAASVPAGPVPSPGDPESCRGCHPAQVEEWRGSPHAGAATTEGFLASLRRFAAWLEEHPPAAGQPGSRPAPAAAVAERCLGCHVPGAADPPVVAGRLLSGAAAAGVTCQACHGGTPAAHPTRYLAGITAAAPAEACARCHRWEPPGVACSTVFDGWRASPAAAAGTPCQGCHMPAGSHRFEGSRSPAMLARAVALSLTAEAGAQGPVALIEVRNLAGHRLPDG